MNTAKNQVYLDLNNLEDYDSEEDSDYECPSDDDDDDNDTYDHLLVEQEDSEWLIYR